MLSLIDIVQALSSLETVVLTNKHPCILLNILLFQNLNTTLKKLYAIRWTAENPFVGIVLSTKDDFVLLKARRAFTLRTFVYIQLVIPRGEPKDRPHRMYGNCYLFQPFSFFFFLNQCRKEQGHKYTSVCTCSKAVLKCCQLLSEKEQQKHPATLSLQYKTHRFA